MNKKPIISDEEIRKTMDFDSLLKQHLKTPSQSATGKRAFVFSLSVVVILSAGYFFWAAQKETLKGKSLTTIEKVATPSVPSPAQGNTVTKPKPSTISKKPSGSETKEQSGTISKIDSATAKETYIEAEPVSGFPKLYEYLNHDIIYPKQLIRDSIQGVESVSFIIDESGKVDRITILHSLGKPFDEEAIRLLNAMPPWKPARLNGKTVASRVTLPLNFSIQAATK